MMVRLCSHPFHVDHFLIRLFKTLGYQRTLQATDLWKLDESHSAEVLSTKFDNAWELRRAKAQAWNADLAKGLINPSTSRRFIWFLYSLLAGRNYSRRREELEKQWREHDGQKHPSIALALNDALGFFFWTGGAFKVTSIAFMFCGIIFEHSS
jgi:ATP-binding cassette subfamily C (CFTR/MRP) protein 1